MNQKRIVSYYCLNVLLLLSYGHLILSTQVTLEAQTNDGSVGQGCSWYIDEFGPTRSDYSMGDFVRYTVTPGDVQPAHPQSAFMGKGLNCYYGMANIPYAQDVYQSNHNQLNLYNFIGNLFAGYAALHINPVGFPKNNVNNWLAYRKAGGGSLKFDNNTYHQYTIQLVDYGRSNGQNTFPYNIYGKALGNNESSFDQGKGFLTIRTRKYGTSKFLDDGTHPLDSASCAWCSNATDGNFVLAVETTPNYLNYAAPYGQFFGARLCHILGAVVNDVPTEKNNGIVVSMATGTPMPQMAILNGGPYTTLTAPIGLTTQSTAHFGTIQNFIQYWSVNEVSQAIKNSLPYAYLVHHLLPTVQRFATGGPASSTTSNAATTPLCSYQMAVNSAGANLIQINDSYVTAYDNGVIVGIANNTQNELVVRQCVFGDNDYQIGILAPGNNNFYLHTASLMPQVSNQSVVTTNTDPTLGNMIEIKDMQANASVFLQLLNADQLATLVQQPGGCAATGSCGDMADYFGLFSTASNALSLSYNQSGTYQLPTQNNQLPATYLVVSNFDLQKLSDYILAKQNNTGASIPSFADMRVQAINLTSLQGKPYAATLQINKVLQTYGLNNGVIREGNQGSYALQPSIVTVKSFSWLNPYAQAQGPLFYSAIPLLMLPDFVMNADISGLAAHYGIWLMSYVAALTEFKFNAKFGNMVDCLKNCFNFFGVTEQGQVPARVVIDTNGYLASGQQLMLTVPNAQNTYDTNLCYAIMGCDVFDVGQNFHQDIPILSLYADAAGNPVANQDGGQTLNLNLTFNQNGQDTEEEISDPSVADLYGMPCANMMLFCVPTASMDIGVRVTIQKTASNSYQVMIADANSEMVFAVQTLFLNDQNTNVSATLSFLNAHDSEWDSMTMLPALPRSVGQSVSFVVKHVINGTTHQLELSVKSMAKKVVKKNVKATKKKMAKNKKSKVKKEQKSNLQ